MNLSMNFMLLSLVFSGIGFVLFMYGKKQHKVVPLCSGLALLIYPYVIDNTTWLVIIGIVLCAIPYFYRP